MDGAQPSRTALAAARHRAAHQLLEQGRIFADPLAVNIIEDEPQLYAGAAQDASARGMRFFIAARARFSEDALTTAISDGVRQAVILGAGLDTLAYRLPAGTELQVFEVDHPRTQAWKRERLRAAAIAEPPCVTYVPVDFERETLLNELRRGGLDTGRPAFFSWLGVVPYLQEEAVWSVLRAIASIPGGQVVFDYSDPPATLEPQARRRHEERARRVSALGEAWITYFEPAELRRGLVDRGFTRIDDLGPPQIAGRYMPGASPRDERGGHLVWAAR